ncbi:MAG: sensor histidine kinase [Turicibacter sp.]|nr:sensor histidine kinase [Turicibacter sp.]
MSFLAFIKSKGMFLGINGLLFLTITLLMMLIHVNGVIIFFVGCIWFMPLFSYMMLDYIKYRRYFMALEESVQQLDQAYLICEVVEEPSFLEGQMIHELLRVITKDMHEHVNRYKRMEQDYREYIEAWVHEIKTPIASVKLVLENNSGPLGQKVDFELRKVENFIDQVLYYARSFEVSQDYVVKEFELREVVLRMIRQNSREFIYHKVGIQIGELDGIVFSDAKWVEFILNQLINNAIKYTKKEDGKVSFETMIHEQSVVLMIKDEGVGINEKDLPRVFDKGFTGENGRLFGKSTGIGLYLCQKLCQKLRIGLEINSQKEGGTTVYLTFPKGKFAFLEE